MLSTQGLEGSLKVAHKKYTITPLIKWTLLGKDG